MGKRVNRREVKASELVAGQAYWDKVWLRHLWYKGRAYNAYEYEFVNAEGHVITLCKSQVEQLEQEV